MKKLIIYTTPEYWIDIYPNVASSTFIDEQIAIWRKTFYKSDIQNLNVFPFLYYGVDESLIYRYCEKQYAPKMYVHIEPEEIYEEEGPLVFDYVTIIVIREIEKQDDKKPLIINALTDARYYDYEMKRGPLTLKEIQPKNYHIPPSKLELLNEKEYAETWVFYNSEKYIDDLKEIMRMDSNAYRDPLIGGVGTYTIEEQQTNDNEEIYEHYYTIDVLDIRLPYIAEKD